jgi:signal transduction histidine kinase
MRIQTRLFLGTALLVLTLVVAQWWLHSRQLGAIEHELGAVAATVGKGLLAQDPELFVTTAGEIAGGESTMLWVDGTPAASKGRDDGEETSDSEALGAEEESATRVTRRVERIIRHGENPAGETEYVTEHVVAFGMRAPCEESELDIHIEGDPEGKIAVAEIEDGTLEVEGRRIELRVVSVGQSPDRFLVLSDDGGIERRVPIPIAPTYEIVRSTLEKGLAVGGGLLMVGLVGSGLLASRLSRPLRHLANGAEAVGRGELGVQVPETAAGEIGDLQRSFNRMSRRLAELEAEKELWRQREHLAQLGDLSRGLAHTLRNPLNALGLAVEELADDRPTRSGLVTTARNQIRRIDRWLRSFLALGAGDAAESVEVDLRELARDVALEAIQEGARIELDVQQTPLPVRVVPTAVRAAIANLVENAADASPAGASIEMMIRRDGDDALVSVADRGSGLPDEVRRRLYAPHVTTKVGGSGMGLFLARQLVAEMNRGRLEVQDRVGGGTLAEVRFSLVVDDDGVELT